MVQKQSIRALLACFLVILAAVVSALSYAQAPVRTSYSAPGDWTVTTYRAGDTGAFLRCSAERHYEDGQTLTIAINSAGKYVLGFTSDKWTYEDRSTHPVSIRVDSNREQTMPGRVRILPVGPMVFLDLDTNSTVIAQMSAGNSLHVNSADTSFSMSLAGSAATVASARQCYLDASE